MGYGFSALLASGSLAEVEQTLLLRALLSPAGHVAWTGLTVAARWSVPTSRRKGLAMVRGWCLRGRGAAARRLGRVQQGVGTCLVGGLSLLALLRTIRWAHRDPTAPRRGRT